MIVYKTGSIFDDDAQCLVNPVNCIGVMGKGLAKEFKQRYPDMFIAYKKLCNEGRVHIGGIGFYTIPDIEIEKMICFFPTKYDWRQRSTVTIIDTSLQQFCKHAPKMKIKSAAFPMVGCGYGGLSFEYEVQPLLEKYFTESKFDIRVYI